MTEHASLPEGEVCAPTISSPVRHLAIIMDGNGRWAQKRGLSRSEGHRAGTEAARTIVEECVRLGMGHLTLYTFSKENWKRPEAEVSFLFKLLVDFITQELPTLKKQGVQLRVFGEVSGLPFSVQKALQHAMQRTKDNTKMILNLALNYSGRDEIVRACRRHMEQGGTAEEFTEERLAGLLYSAGQPDPDLVIRTSGEIRISNFLLFQSAYSEYCFLDLAWPDFTSARLHEALEDFRSRNRRFGDVVSAENTSALNIE